MGKAVERLAQLVSVISGVITSLYLTGLSLTDPFQRGMAVGVIVCAVGSCLVYAMKSRR